MPDKVINRKTSNPWSQRRLFKGGLDQRLANSTKASKRAHVASISSHFFEALAASVLGGRRGATDPDSDICPDVHIRRGSQPTLVEVKGGSRRRHFKCDTRQLQKYVDCGERVEYAFIARDYKRDENISDMADTIQDVFDYYASRISYMVVLDVSVVAMAWYVGDLFQRRYDSWNSNHTSGFDCIYMSQKFLRNIMDDKLVRTPSPIFVWRKRQRRTSAIEVSGVKFQINSFPLVELVRPDSETPF